MSVNEAGSAGRRGQAAYHLHIYPQLATSESQAPPLASCRVPATKDSTTSDVIQDAVARLQLDGSKRYVLVEVKETGGEEWVLDASDSPVHRVLLWPRRAHDEHPREDGYYFLLQERDPDGTIKYLHMQLASQATATRRLEERGLLPRPQADFDDLCNLPELTEENLLKNLRHRFLQQKIYTYAGSILVAVNPFKFLPIYNPKYVKMYENQQLGKLEPHVFALADVAYYAMLRKHINQCIVISGESGSGKTQSTNFLIHCLTALSQKGYASGVERTILGAGPVLEVSGGRSAGGGLHMQTPLSFRYSTAAALEKAVTVTIPQKQEVQRALGRATQGGTRVHQKQREPWEGVGRSLCHGFRGEGPVSQGKQA